MEEDRKKITEVQLFALCLILLIICSLGNYFLNEISSKKTFVSVTTIKSNTTPTLSFVVKEELNDNEEIATTSIPQFESSIPFFVAVNKNLLADFSNSSCPDLDSDASIDEMYQEAFISDEMSSTTISKVSKQQKLDAIKKASFYSDWSASSTLITPSVVSFDVSTSNYCGGPHPNENEYGLNYLLTNKANGRDTVASTTDVYLINFSDIFNDYPKHTPEVVSIFEKEIMNNYDPVEEADCIDTIEEQLDPYVLGDENRVDVDPINFSLDKGGITVLSLGLPHAYAPCEPAGIYIPYSAFGGLINQDFLKLVQ